MRFSSLRRVERFFSESPGHLARRMPQLAAVVCVLLALQGLLRAQAPSALRWGGDAEGGAPYVEADPNNPQNVKGFDVEIATLIAASMRRTPEFLQVAFASLDQSASRGDFDIGLSGIEDTPARRATVAASIPYYRFREVLTVREADRDRYRSLADLRGRRVATLSGTIAYDLLLAAEREQGIDRGLLRRRRASVLGPAGRARRRRAAGQRARRPGAPAQPRPVRRARTGADRALRRHHRAAESRVAQRRQCRPARRDAGRPARADHAEVERVERRPAAAVRRDDRGGDRSCAGHGSARAVGTGPGDDASLPALAAARGSDHADPVVSVDGDGGWVRHAVGHRAGLRQHGRAGGADRLRRGDARHAGAAAAVRDLLRSRPA